MGCQGHSFYAVLFIARGSGSIIFLTGVTTRTSGRLVFYLFDSGKQECLGDGWDSIGLLSVMIPSEGITPESLPMHS